MEEFKIGGKVIINEDESYRIVDIIKLDEKPYYFACTEEKPITPKIFERIQKNGKTYISIVENPQIIRMISEKILKGNNG